MDIRLGLYYIIPGGEYTEPSTQLIQAVCKLKISKIFEEVNIRPMVFEPQVGDFGVSLATSDFHFPFEVGALDSPTYPNQAQIPVQRECQHCLHKNDCSLLPQSPEDAIITPGNKQYLSESSFPAIILLPPETSEYLINDSAWLQEDSLPISGPLPLAVLSPNCPLPPQQLFNDLKIMPISRSAIEVTCGSNLCEACLHTCEFNTNNIRFPEV